MSDELNKSIMEMEEEYIAIPIKEYEHLKRCKEELFTLYEAEIVKLRNQIQSDAISSIVNSHVNN